MAEQQSYNRLHVNRCIERGERLREVLVSRDSNPAQGNAVEHNASRAAVQQTGTPRGAASLPARRPGAHQQLLPAGRALRCAASTCTVSIMDLSREMRQVTLGPHSHLAAPCNLPNGPRGTIELYLNGCDETSMARDGFISVFLVACAGTTPSCMCGARITFSLRGRTPNGEPKHFRYTHRAPNFGQDLRCNGRVKEGIFYFVRRSEVVLNTIAITVHVECCAAC